MRRLVARLPAPLRELGDLFRYFVLPGVLVWIMLTTLTPPFEVRKMSMDPALMDGQLVFLWRLPYMGPFSALGGPRRGDIVILREPGLGRVVVKRVVGLAGETLSSTGTKLLIDGKPYEEPYLGYRVKTPPFEARTVPAGSYFVVGDNRVVSYDSRMYGPARRDEIIGIVMFSLMPLERFGTFDNPAAEIGPGKTSP